MNADMARREGRFQGVGGLSIYWQAWEPRSFTPAGQATVVIAHGYGEHSGRYKRLAAQLVEQGCVVYALDHRGHGCSQGNRGLIDRFEHAIDDMQVVVDMARKGRAQGPVFLLGHSLGGALALGFAFSHAEKIDGLLLSGPAVSLASAGPAVIVLSRWLSRLAPEMGIKGIDASAVSRDPDEVAAYLADPLNYLGKVPARTAGEIVHFVQRLPERLTSLRLPVLAQHGGADSLASPHGSRQVISAARSDDKTLHVYEGLYHEIFNERPVDRERVIRDLVGWIHAHTPPPSATAASSGGQP